MTEAFDLLCPLVTPMRDDGRLDEARIATLVDHLVAAGIDGFVPCGTTGEFAGLTDEERLTVVEATVDAADGRVPVTAGVGGNATADVRRRVEAADAAGADAVLLPPPYFGGQVSAAGNEAFFREVLDDSPLPVYLYNIPQAVGQELQADAVVSLADHDAVAGIKDSSGDVTYFGDLVRRTPDDVVVYQGWDAAYVPTLALGADGGVHALAHLFPEAFRDAADAVAAGDLDRARNRQLETIDPAFEYCREHGFAASVKAGLAGRGLLGSAAVRPPMEPVTDVSIDPLLHPDE